ncbi:hypothetical protein [Dactylosporangium sp. NPDC005555]|uniref:hypothetical protein n=1 Tax=Dactylosporangium sp. NPDC005555 TaxID=3154889 RepID=UPI0033B22CBB
MAVRSVFLVAACALALGGCAASPSPSSPSGAASVSASPSLSPVPSLSAVPSRAASGVSVSGEVVEGVEPGCLLLRTSGTLYLLIGGDRAALQAGKRVTVTGSPQPGMMSTCQQGTPFQVTSVRSG